MVISGRRTLRPHSLCGFAAAVSLLTGASAVSTPGPADRAYRNGVIFTADAANSRVEALAIRDGRIVYLGSNSGLAPYVDARTALHHESLIIGEFQQRIQVCPDGMAMTHVLETVVGNVAYTDGHP